MSAASELTARSRFGCGGFDSPSGKEAAKSAWLNSDNSCSNDAGRATVKGLVADGNIQGQVEYLVQRMQADAWADFW
jgi:hypothetical protein